jgi:HAD superfamily hydrolase (TIGR01459 family)
MLELVPHVSRLSAIIESYDAIISDVWGVLHNGIVATDGAHQALAHARRAGKAVILLTNAPRPPGSIREQLRSLAIPDDSYDAIVSSGGVTRELMSAEGAKPFYHLGPERDRALYAGLAASPAPFEDATYILCTGLFDDETETAEDYRAQLVAARTRGLRLYCANPDLIVERGDRLIPCAGAVADLYESLGGEVSWVGKPRPLVYERVRALIAETLGRMPSARRILCIGDALRTDVAGANAAGHDCIMTLAGIHAHQIGLKGQAFDGQALSCLARESGFIPTMSMVSLHW